jgi:hypothetical protein
LKMNKLPRTTPYVRKILRQGSLKYRLGILGIGKSLLAAQPVTASANDTFSRWRASRRLSRCFEGLSIFNKQKVEYIGRGPVRSMDYGSINPIRIAYLTASATPPSRSFNMIRARWPSTVLTLIPRRSAVTRLDSPPTKAIRISLSRGVRALFISSSRTSRQNCY